MLQIAKLQEGWSPTGTIVKADEYRALVAADQLVAAAEQRATEIVAQAQAEFENQRSAGYAAGLAQAQMEAARNCVQTSAKLNAHMRSLDEQLSNMIVAGVSRIIGEVPNSERIVALVREGLRELSGQTKVIVEVHPNDIEHVSRAIKDLRSSSPGLEFLEVNANPRLNPDACILRSDWHVVDASVETQLETLRQVLTSDSK